MKKMAIMMVVVAGGMLMFAGCGKEPTPQERAAKTANDAGKDIKAAANDASKEVKKTADGVAKDVKAATK